MIKQIPSAITARPHQKQRAMPLYEFESKGGEVIEALAEPEQRVIEKGGKKYYRRSVQRISIVGKATPPGMAKEILEFYKKKEEKEGARFYSRFSKETIKKAWENDTEPYYDQV